MTFRVTGIVAFILLAVTSAEAQTQHQTERDLAAAVDALVQPEADAGLLSGTILIARRDKILLQRSYGFANWELQVPISPASRFPVASITKVMTAALVDALVKEGRLDLDAPVSRYIPGFPKGPKGGVPTVRQLRDHRSGTSHRVTTAVDETQRLLPVDIVERVKQKGLLFEPGTEELYSSAGYTALARVIEIIEQKPFARVLAEKVFRPAGMTHATDETSQRIMPGRVMPYQFSTGEGKLVVASAPYKDLSFLTGAGSVYATAEDLLHFVHAARAGILGKEAQAFTTGSGGPTWRGWYGRNNTEASVDVMPSGEITFVFLANLRSAVTWQLRAQVKNLLQGAATTPIKRPPAPVTARFEPTASFVGLYGLPSDPVEVSEFDGNLLRDGNEFYPIEGRRYYIPASGSVMWFRRGTDGSVDAMLTVRGDGSETVQPRIK